MTLEILDWQPARLNELLNCHWAVASRRKQADRLRIAIACAKRKKAKGHRTVTLTWILGPKMRRPDADGVWKSLLDALVQCGQLVDDSPKWVTLNPVQYERGPRKGIRLTVEGA